MSQLRRQSRRCEPDPEYPSCAGTHAELRIYPGSLAPEEVSAVLGAEPTHACRCGAVVVNSLGRTRRIDRNGWFLSSEGKVASYDLRHHLDWLLRRLSACRSALLALQDRPGVKMAVCCTWWSTAGHCGPVLWPEQTGALARLNLECSFDILCNFDEEEDEDEEEGD